jgi:hypothetical protein
MAEMIKDFMEQGAVVRLLRCTKTHRYFTGEGWSEDPGQAKVFMDEIEAVRACVYGELQNVELVLRAFGAHTDLFCTAVR